MKRWRTRTSAICLALVLAVTTAIGCVVLTGLGMGLYEEWSQSRQLEVEPSYYEEFRVQADGTPVITRHVYRPRWSEQHVTLDGEPIEVDDNWTALAELPEKPREESLMRERLRARVKLVAHGVGGRENWYVLTNGERNGRCYFQGLDAPQRRTVGYIGLRGFQQEKPARDEQFPIQSYPRLAGNGILTSQGNRAFLLPDGGLCLIDFANRTVESTGQRIISMDRLDPGEFSFQLAVRTEDRVDVLNLSGEAHRRFVIPADMRGKPFEFTVLGDEALYCGRRGEFDVVWANEAGEVTRRASFRTARRSSPQNISDENARRVFTAAVPAPVWGIGLWGGLSAWLDSRLEGLSYSAAFGRFLRVTWAVLLAELLLAGWLGWLTLRQQREQGEADGWAWCLFVVLFGLPGYAGYSLHRSWPLAEPIAPPEPTGIEVYA